MPYTRKIHAIYLSAVLLSLWGANTLAEPNSSGNSSKNSHAQSKPVANPRIQAYQLLQQPYRECIKAALKSLYETKVASCIEAAGALASIDQCQNLAETETNQEAGKPETKAHCNKLKPSKQQFEALVKKLSLQNSNP